MTWYVNGEAIDDKDIHGEAEKLRPRYEQVFADMPAEEREGQLQEWSRENVVEAVLMRQAAAREVPSPPQEVVERAYEHLLAQAGGKDAFFENTGLPPDQEDRIRRDLARRLQMERLIARITEAVPEPTDKEITRYYEQHRDRFTVPEMVRAAHIVKHPTPATDPQQVETEMRQILDQLQAGADFAKMAAEHSDCPDNGGDLGFFARGQMVEAFDAVVFDMQPGEISDVFRTEYGFHIATVLERRPAIPCPLDEVRPVIVKELTEAARQRALEQFVDAEKAKATIEEK